MSPGSEPVWIAIKMLDHYYVCDKIKNAQKGILRRWYSRKHQKSVSSLRHSLHWQNLSDVNILELWVLLKACNFQGGRLRWSIVIHFGPFQLLAEQQLLIPPRLSPVADSCACVPGAARTKLTGTRVDKKERPCPPDIGDLCALIADCY